MAAQVLDLTTTPGHLVRCAQQVHWWLWHEEFAGELTSPQYGVLATLSSSPDIDQRTAGELVSLDKSNIADVVRRLERRGWITRVRDDRDARRNLLELTPAAQEALERITPAAARVQSRLLEPLTAAHRSRFPTTLARVAYQGRSAVPRAEAPESGPALPLSATPGHLIRRTEQVHYSLWHEELGGELTSPQYAVMSALRSCPDIDQRTAGELASLDKSNIADVVRRLERRGWITRVRDDRDARRNLLELTPTAQEALERITPAAARVQARLLAPLPTTEQLMLVKGLAAITRHRR